MLSWSFIPSVRLGLLSERSCLEYVRSPPNSTWFLTPMTCAYGSLTDLRAVATVSPQINSSILPHN